MLSPKYWSKKARMEEALREYPLYDPPHKSEERILSDAAVAENFSYFMETRQSRVANLQEWLRECFGVMIYPDHKDIATTLVWLSQYGDLLLDETSFNPAFYTYDPPWTGRLTSYNVIFDVGTAFGESVISQVANIEWATDWSIERYPSERINGLSYDDMTTLRQLQRYWSSERNKRASGIGRPILLNKEKILFQLWPHLKIQTACECLRPKTSPYVSADDYEDPAPQVLENLQTILYQVIQ